MADNTNPNAGKNTSSSFLPRFYRSDANKKFLQATVDQLIQPGTVRKVNGYIGRQNAKATTGEDIFISATDSSRQNYQLEPGFIVKDSLDNVTFFKDYQDYVNQISVFGGNVANHARLNKEEMYSWDPHIDWDKFSNFQNYYWLPYGPDTIKIYGKQLTSVSTLTVKVEAQGDNNTYVFTPDGLTRNPVLKLYRGQTYKFEIDSPGNPFSFKTTRSLGSVDRYSDGVDKVSVENGTITFEVPFNAPTTLYYQSEADINLGGAIAILAADENSSINVEEEIIGKKTYTLSNGTELSNGMKVSFGGNVTPASYAVSNYYVEGVGTGIRLVDEKALEVISEYTETQAILFDATPFDKQPFSDATAYAGVPDYILINRASLDTNPWSRYNRWFHIDVIEKSAAYNGKVPDVDQSARAVRPIIEFEAGIKLFNFGTYATTDVDLIDNYTTDVFSTIEGSLGYNIDGVDLVRGHRVLFTADTDRFVQNKVYEVDFIDVQHSNQGSRQIHLKLVAEPNVNQVVLVKRGDSNQGQLYWYDGSSWNKTQQKTKINQPPLFDVVDSNKVSYGDKSVYDGSTFVGTKLFSYKEGTGTVDANLGFALSYKNINNVGDIVFNFNLASDVFQYRDVSAVVDQKVSTGFLVKTITGFDAQYVNGWQTSVVNNTQAAVRIYKNSGKTNNFSLDIYDNKDDLSDLVVKVYVNGIRLNSSNWSLVDSPVYKKIVLTSDIELSDVLTIKSYAAQSINSNGFYEVPSNLQNNPLNNSIGDFTLGEVIDHVSSIVENQQEFIGNFPGSSNLRDLGNVSGYGTRFVQHSGPLSLAVYHVTSDTNNIVKAIEQSRDDYNKFKKYFITIAESLGVDADPKTQVDKILQIINQDKPESFPYYFSDMAPYGANIKTNFTVVDGRIKSYPLSTPFNLETLSNKAVGVYLNNNQLLHGCDYSFDSQGFVVISNTVALAENDIITTYEYESTDGCFIPETPTKLGIWPKYEPKIYLDTALLTPRTMIQGHDGSQVLAYDDYRDAIILELEKRIYNNIKVKYNPDIYDIIDIVPSYNRKTDYSLDEFNEVLAPSFYKWTTLIDRDFTKPLSFDRDNSLTFNYNGHVAPDGRPTPGYWRGIYLWTLDTDRPNICPWEMLGFTEEPKWWADTYGPSPYTSDNLVMWRDISEGIVREPGVPQVVKEKYKKPFLLDHIPVDENGNIKSPLLSGIATGPITSNITGDFVFGDGSPIEGAWRRSSHYPFSVILTAMLLAPAKTFGLLLDRSRIIRSLTGQLVYKDTGLAVTASDIKLPSIYSSIERVQTAGIINYLVNYILSDTLKSYETYNYDLKNISPRLTHKLGSFTSKEKFKLILDSKTPLSSGSVFVPPENYDIVLNTSSPVKKITYSAVIVTKLADGFEVKGYSKTAPYFKYFPWIQAGLLINVGGISESYVVWTPGQQYAAEKIVSYGNRYYRVKATHTAKTEFEPQYYQILPSLPMVGGRDAFIRSQWDRDTAITVPYGTKFKTHQEVVDFLLGYGEWLKDQGFVFDEFNATLQQVTNWETSAKEFLFWTTQNWSTGEDKWDEWSPDVAVPYGSIVRYNGDYYRAVVNSPASAIFEEDNFVKLDGLSTVGSSVISLSPAAAKLTFSAPNCVVDDIRNPFNGYEIFKVDGTPIEPKFLNSYREDNAVSYTPEGEDGIYGASFYLVQKEQVVILNNTTMFNDTIYSPESGYRQERIKVSGYVSSTWNGSFDVPGFVFDQAKINDWEAWKDYALGDIVKHKQFYYSASKFIPGEDAFSPENWIKLEEKPSASLIPNWTYKASQFEDFYSLDSDNFDVGQQTIAQHLIGYQKRQYLSNIIKDDVSEFKFYQGMIIEKGTKNVLNKLFDVLSADDQESLTFDEEWAVRVGRYGASSAYETVEFILDEAEFKNNPQGFELVNLIDKKKIDFISRQTPSDVYLKPIGYNSNPWPILNNSESYLRPAGHVKESEVRSVVRTIDDVLTVDITQFNDGDYIWTTFDGPSWNVWRFTDLDYTVLDVTYGSNKLTVTLDKLVNFPVGTVIGITQVNFSGFYKVTSVDLNKFEAAATISGWQPFNSQDSILIHQVTRHRINTIDELDLLPLRKFVNNELVWTGGPGTSEEWKTWKFSPAYLTRTFNLPYSQDGLKYGKAVALSKKANLTAMSTALGEVVVYDKAGMSSPWIQRDTITPPFVSTITSANLPDQFGESLAFSQDNLWMAVGSPTISRVCAITNSNGLKIADVTGVESGLTSQGVVAIYKKDSNNIFSLVNVVTSPAPASYENFGSSLIFSGSTLLVGAPGANNNTGKVYRLEYKTLVKASAEYNPVGSSGTTVALSTVDNVEVGMLVVGTGFTSQTVVSVDTVFKTITVETAPLVEPTGTIQFVVTDWVYDSAILPTAPAVSYSYFGTNLQVSDDGNTIVVSAPGSVNIPGLVSTTVNGAVFVYSNNVTQIIVGEPLFGKSISLSNTADYLAISSVLYDNTAQDQGKVVVYSYDSESNSYIEYQTINSKDPENVGYFGSKVAFMNGSKTLVIYSQNGDTSVPMTFNADQSLYPTESGTETTFDKKSTNFKSFQPNSGRVDIYDRYLSNWVFGESLEAVVSENDGYGQGLAASNNHIVVSAPFAESGSVKSGTVFNYYKTVDTFSWSVIHSEITKPDVTKIKKAFLYNKSDNTLVDYLDVVDVSQGKIPGIADQEISFKTFYDPATYSVGTSNVNVDLGQAWTTSNVGMLWWDLRTAKFVESYDNDIVYRNSTWNTLAAGASIDVYEWVESKLLPADWDSQADTEEGLALGISGLSLYGNNAYSIVRKYDNIAKTFKNTYYYWVKNKKTIPNTSLRSKSAQDVADLISNPRGEGYKYIALTGINSFSLINVKPSLHDKDVVLAVEYWTVDTIGQNIHSEWKLINNSSKSDIPKYIEQKWIDSLCGKDTAGRLVPDMSLPPKIRYGIENRPRQSMFINRTEALKQTFEKVNSVLLQNQIVEQRDISLLESYDKEPSLITGTYDTVVDTDSELRFANVGSFKSPTITLNVQDGKIVSANIINKGQGYLTAPYLEIVGTGHDAVVRAVIDSNGRIVDVTIVSSGYGYTSDVVCTVRNYSVLVHSDSGANNVWSIYSYDPDSQVWSRIRSQTYDTRKYWNYVDWYASGFTQFSAIDYAVNTFTDLNLISPTVHELVKVKTTSTGGWLLLEKYADSTSVDWTQSYRVVGSEKGTIQLDSSLYEFDNTDVGYDSSLYDTTIFDNLASVELRNIFISLRDDILIDDLRSAYIDLFFIGVRYALSEQTYLDWIFKTSFVKAQHNVGKLHKTVTYSSDNLSDFESYISEVKPFRTKVREYVSVYNELDNSSVSTTDFDLMPIFENGKLGIINTSVNNGDLFVDNPAILTYPWKHWLDNLGFSVTEIRLIDGGSGYINPPVVRIESTSGTGATARAFVSSGRVTRILVLTSGSGYLSAPTITLDGGLAELGTQARAAAIIGNGVTRSTLVKMKFDRVTQTYFITQLQETETFTGTGNRLQFPLKWAPDTRIGKVSVTVNGVDALRASYKLASVKSISKGYTSYSGTITFDTAPAINSTIVVTYLKDWALLNAADRIQYYYNPVAGQVGKDLSQLMTGIDYGGVIVNGLGFNVGAGWDSVPFYADKWDSSDITFDDYLVTVAANTHTFTLPYTPASGTEINIYQRKASLETYVSDGVTTGYIYNTDVNDPTVYASWETVSNQIVPEEKNVAGSYVLTVNDTSGVKPGDIVTTTVPNLSIFGYKTVVTEVYGSTDVKLDQILFDDIPFGTPIVFTRELIDPTDLDINANGTILLKEPAITNTNIIITGNLPLLRLDDAAFSVVSLGSWQTLTSYSVGAKVFNGANEYICTTAHVSGNAFFNDFQDGKWRTYNTSAVMEPFVADGTTAVVSIPLTVSVATGDQFILRKSTSDGSITPAALDYDTSLTGGDLAYSTATGLLAEDIIVDGDGFVTPTTSSGPEEVVPGQVVDAVAIKVYDHPRTGAANVQVDNYISNGVADTFKYNQLINSPQAIVVKVTTGTSVIDTVTGEEVIGTQTSILTQDVDYTVNYPAGEVTLGTTPILGAVVSIFTFGFGGTNVLDLDYFIADGVTPEFITKAPWLDELTSLVYVNGVPSIVELFQTDYTYDTPKLVGIRFSDPPPANAVINFVIVSGLEQTFIVTKKEIIIADGRNQEFAYDLSFDAGDSLPIETSMIVRANQNILKAANNQYFTIKSNRLNYKVDPSKFLPYSVDITDIEVYADGKPLSQGLDYIVDLSGITIKINKIVYTAYAGKDLIVSITKDADYSYTPRVGSVPPKIKFKQIYTGVDLIEIISSYKHDPLGIQRTATNTTSVTPFSVDTVEYFNYKDILGGIIKLDRAVADDSKIWVIKNNTILTPTVDFKVNDDKQSITLASNPSTTDQFTFMTFSSNTYTAGIAYMQFKDMLNRVHFKRLSLKKQTRLAVDLRVNDTVIELDDASNFDIPNPLQNKPGIIEIRGERIEYFAINGNTLSQLRRGTLGTGTPSVHPVGSFVQDIGKTETIPYIDENVVEQVTSDGTLTVPLTFVPGGFDTTWTYQGRNITSEEVSTLAKNAVEVFVGGYDTTGEWTSATRYNVGDIVTVGSYSYRAVEKHLSGSTFAGAVSTLDVNGDVIETDVPSSTVWQFFIGNIRLKKDAYSVYNVNIAPESPEGDVNLPAEFAVDGISSEITLTHKLNFGTQVTVVKKTGKVWDSVTNIQQANGKIADFLKSEPGIWYSTLGNRSDLQSSFDSTTTTFDNSNVTFDKGN